MIILGIDPGARSAAYAVLLCRQGCPPVLQEAGDVPVAANMVDAAAFARLVQSIKPTLAIVELVGSMPKQGLASTFKFGMGCGLLRGVILGSGVALYQATPAVWKRHFHLSADKEQARALAVRLFPQCTQFTRKKDAGRAEAALLALYLSRTLDPI